MATKSRETTKLEATKSRLECTNQNQLIFSKELKKSCMTSSKTIQDEEYFSKIWESYSYILLLTNHAGKNEIIGAIISFLPKWLVSNGILTNY